MIVSFLYTTAITTATISITIVYRGSARILMTLAGGGDDSVGRGAGGDQRRRRGDFRHPRQRS